MEEKLIQNDKIIKEIRDNLNINDITEKEHEITFKENANKEQEKEKNGIHKQVGPLMSSKNQETQHHPLTGGHDKYYQDPSREILYSLRQIVSILTSIETHNFYQNYTTLHRHPNNNQNSASSHNQYNHRGRYHRGRGRQKY